MATIIKRSDQLSLRINDPFSPLKVTSSTEYGKSNLSYFTKEHSTPLSDDILDGVFVINKSSSEVWEEENKLHSARALSKNIDNTRGFLGRQVTAIFDDINLITYVAFIEKDGLIVTILKNGDVISRKNFFIGHTQRVHLALNKYNGELFALHASENDSKTSLYLNEKIIPTKSKNIDFPYMVFSQSPIGHVQKTEPKYALITYKCRDTGILFYRSMANGKIGEEKEFNNPKCLGGLDFEINDNTILFRIDTIKNDILVPMIATSENGGKDISAFSKIDLSQYKPDAILPEGSGIVKDYLGNFQIPVTTMKNGSRYLLNILSDDKIVEAMELASKGFGTILARFPKKPSIATNALGRGDGKTDGTGIIAVGLSEGSLFSSNSQSGGINFPPARQLNYEMQKIFAFKSTDNCYSRSVTPNTVSMDYFYLESDGRGNTVSQELFFESWDMPLPEPVINSKSTNNKIEINIVKDGWFEEAKTTFELSDKTITITDVNIINDRQAVVTCDNDNLAGLSITYEMKSVFYWHIAKAIVE